MKLQTHHFREAFVAAYNFVAPKRGMEGIGV